MIRVETVNKRTNKGFTIIEVVLVLAIAGLIFLMVFVALPALQRGQRDTQRRDAVAQVASQLTNYQTNNDGKLPQSTGTTPTSIKTFFINYMNKNDDFKDPSSGESYLTSDAANNAANNASLSLGTIQYKLSARCNGENMQTGGSSTRQAALRIKLEGAGYFCQEVN
jgi:prepilin-type N-terminal cleavage/methylation domain-containing protein